MQNWKVVNNPIKNRLSVDTGEEGIITPGEGLARSAEHDQMAHLIAAAPDLLAALEEFEIDECPHCNGSGSERPTDKDDACHRCGGSGEILRGGWPDHVRAAIAKAKGQS